MSNPQEFDVTFPSDTARGREVQEQIVGVMEQCGFSAREVFGVRLALEEALVNAIKHGNQMDIAKSVHVWWRVDDEHIQLSIQDEGPGFDVTEVPDPTDDENIDKPGGRGIMLMRAFMSEVKYNETGNCLMMEKRKGEDDE